MEEESGGHPWSHMFVESSSLEELQAPLKRSTRLKYSCLSVSPRLIALGSNTGGIYVFSRENNKILQVVFADKETSSVSMVMLSPNDKYAAFSVITGAIHVMDLKIESQAKPETVSSVSDLGGAMVTTFHWDRSSSKLYVGDDMGRVSVMHTSKAMNLFGTQLEVIMKLDSAIVQLDKREDKLLVSTMSRCYLCDTMKQQFSQIGKKLRDGRYGACFYQPNKSTPTVYCARPGSRIWEVDFEGIVLNTHQFKQLLAIPALPVLTTEGCPVLPGRNDKSSPQSVNFAKLKILSDVFLLSWTHNRLYVFDPVNVKVIFWCDKFKGIQDVCCLDFEVYLYLSNMEVHCLRLLSSIRVIYLCMSSDKWMVAAAMSLFFQENLLKSVPRKLLYIDSFQKLYNEVVKKSNSEIAENLHTFVLKLQNRLAASSDSETADSVTNPPNNAVRSKSPENQTMQISDDFKNQSDMNSNIPSALENTGSRYPKSESNSGYVQQSLYVAESKVSSNSRIPCADSQVSFDEVDFGSNGTLSSIPDGLSLDGSTVSYDTGQGQIEFTNSAIESTYTCSNQVSGHMDSKQVTLSLVREHQTDSRLLIDGPASFKSEHTSDQRSVQKVVTDDELTPVKLENTEVIIENDVQNHAEVGQDPVTKDWEPDSTNEMQTTIVSSRSSNLSPLQIRIKTESDRGSPGPLQDDDEDYVSFRSSNQSSRRPSASSLNSLSSNEVFLEQAFISEKVFPESSDQIAVSVLRKKKKKKSLEEPSLDAGQRRKSAGRIKRSQSTGTIHIPKLTDRQSSPQPSLHSLDEDCVPPLLTQDHAGGRKIIPGSQSVPEADNCLKSRSIPNTPLLEQNTEDYGRVSFAMTPDPALMESGQFALSYDMSPHDGHLSQSWDETAGFASPKTTLLQLRDKVQTKLTTKTKKILQNIKEKKNILAKAAQKDEQIVISDQTEGEEVVTVAPPEADDTEVKGDNSEIRSPIDLTELQQCTEKTKGALQDLTVLTDPMTARNLLLDWITVLNKTFQTLHWTKYGKTGSAAPALQIPENTVNGSVEKKSENQSASEVFQHNSHIDEQNPDKALDKDQAAQISVQNTNEYSVSTDKNYSEIEKRHQKTDSSTSKPNSQFLGACIFKHKDFCHTTDPLCLGQDMFIHVSELARASFDLECHGNILNCSSIKLVENEGLGSKAEVFLELKEADKVPREPSQNKYDKNVVCSDDLLPDKDHCDDVRSQEIVENFSVSDLPPVDCKDENAQCAREIAQTNVTVETMESWVSNGSFQNCDSLLEKHGSADGCGVTDENVVVRETLNVSEGEGRTVTLGEGQSTATHEEQMAYFVRCYYPYLSVSAIREKAHDVSRHGYDIWCALLACLQVEAADDAERYGLDGAALVTHILDTCIHDDKTDVNVTLLGHVARIFRSDSKKVVTACVQCVPHVQPVDVVYLSHYFGLSLDTVFRPYMFQRLEEASRIHRPDSVQALCRHPGVLQAWLDILLSLTDHSDKVRRQDSSPSLFSNRLSWKHENKIDDLLDRYPTQEALDIVTKHGYWKGCLKLLKEFERRDDYFQMVLSLADICLLNNQLPHGVIPDNVENWRKFLHTFELHSKQSELDKRDGNQDVIASSTDWSDRITWDSVAVLLVRHLGPVEAVSLLQEFEVPEGSLSTAFYQVCLLAGMVKKHERLVLHAMLEKIDSYLWSQRPGVLSPKLQFAVVNEKRLVTRNPSSSQRDQVHLLFSELMDKTKMDTNQLIEDPDCDWGVETRINTLCPCCNIPLKESVSHVELGVLLFHCGHGFHKMCLPDRTCFLCLDDDKSETELSFV